MASTKQEEYIRIAGIMEESIVDGSGFRYAVFTQGCPHHCPGCHNPETHDPAGGSLKSVASILREIKSNPMLAGVTLSGGEPFCQPCAAAAIAEGVHAMGKNVWIYSGWTLEELQKKAEQDPDIARLLAASDVLVDGPYLEAQRDLTLRFRGSSNQRIIHLHADTDGKR